MCTIPQATRLIHEGYLAYFYEPSSGDFLGELLYIDFEGFSLRSEGFSWADIYYALAREEIYPHPVTGELVRYSFRAPTSKVVQELAHLRLNQYEHGTAPPEYPNDHYLFPWGSRRGRTPTTIYVTTSSGDTIRFASYGCLARFYNVTVQTARRWANSGPACGVDIASIQREGSDVILTPADRNNVQRRERRIDISVSFADGVTRTYPSTRACAEEHGVSTSAVLMWVANGCPRPSVSICASNNPNLHWPKGKPTPRAGRPAVPSIWYRENACDLAFASYGDAAEFFGVVNSTILGWLRSERTPDSLWREHSVFGCSRLDKVALTRE